MFTTAKQTLSFDQMSGESRIWIYQSNRILNEEESEAVQAEMSTFLADWKAHGNELMAGSELFHGLFLVIALDESFSAASGCSIDTCVRKIIQLGQQFQVDFMDRSNVAIAREREVSLFPLKDISALVKTGEITPSTLVYDNTIQKLSLLDQWIKPAKDTWLKRYFK